ncbi:TRAP transporter small permease subunit [Cocleimonas flava]|uniref:TRAP transporter small permease protein n=1 Tax=Cocleimonas flava TaxID=634765 RepID=A0A4R1F4K8_9GAMM|nr:TRAP transporter small permease subunit [Cocleimonas flava]TCJ88290.1 TRAP-type mannitol/chloroaromatic compound transport system permease small subunit [Cocleimonas flava]
MLLKTEHYINKLMDIIGIIAGILLILLVLIISYNVIGRYAFSNSSIKLEELAWHFYSGVFLLGIPYALRTGSHVRVDIIFEKLSERKRSLIDIVGTLFFLLPMSILIVYYGWDFMAQSYSYGEHSDSVMGLIKQFLTSGIGEKSQDPGGLLNRFIIKGLIPLSFLFLVLSGISFLINRVNVFIHFSE